MALRLLRVVVGWGYCFRQRWTTRNHRHDRMCLFICLDVSKVTLRATLNTEVHSVVYISACEHWVEIGKQSGLRNSLPPPPLKRKKNKKRKERPVGILIKLFCFSGQNSWAQPEQILSYCADKLRAKKWVNFRYRIKFELEGHGRLPAKTIKALTKVFGTFGSIWSS